MHPFHGPTSAAGSLRVSTVVTVENHQEMGTTVSQVQVRFSSVGLLWFTLSMFESSGPKNVAKNGASGTSCIADYGVLAADWKTPAAEGELLTALKTIQAGGDRVRHEFS